LFTCGLVACPGVAPIADRDFAPVIDVARAAPGFTDSPLAAFHHVGFGHHAAPGVADTVTGAVKPGAVMRFVLIGRCDGAEASRNGHAERPACGGEERPPVVPAKTGREPQIGSHLASANRHDGGKSRVERCGR